MAKPTAKPAAHVVLMAVLAAILCVGAVACMLLAAYTDTPEFLTAGLFLLILGIVLMVVARIVGKPKPPSPPPPPPPPPYNCPTCGNPLTFIEQYQRWYCYNCKKYV